MDLMGVFTQIERELLQRTLNLTNIRPPNTLKNRQTKMDTTPTKTTLISSTIYLAFIITSLYYFQPWLIPNDLISLTNNGVIKKQPDLPLRFNADGTFKILQVADLHYGNGIVTRCRDVLETEFAHCSDLNSTRLLKKLIEAEKPDFIAFTGDNIFGSSTHDAAESLFGAFGPAIESRLPWAAVLGNHDQESTMNREELMHFISLMDYSVSQTNPTAEDASHIDGFGNYYVQLRGPPGSQLANNSVFNLYFLDSGDWEMYEGRKTYGWIKESQLRWLRGVSKAFQALSYNNIEPENVLPTPVITPALAFFHIPILETLQVKEIVGNVQEGVASSRVNSGVLQTLVSMGDVKAVFVGHDHTNDFCGKVEGVWLCYGGGIGYHGYGKVGWKRRARVVLAELGRREKGWAGVERIRSWKRLDDEEMTKIDEQTLWIANTR